MKCVFDENLPIKLSRALGFLEGIHGIEVKHMTELVLSLIHISQGIVR